MKRLFLALVVFTSVSANAQWAPTTTSLDVEINRNGNIRANNLTFGRYGSSFVNDSNPYNIFSTDAGENHDLLIFGNSTSTLNMRLYDGDLKLGTSSVPNTLLSNNGNAWFMGSIGIGTTSPQAKFTISQVGNGWNDGLRINRDATNYLTLTEDVTDVRLKNWGTGGILFFTSSGGQVMTINGAGNVGIGTTAPGTYKLAVEGKIGAREVNVTTAAWSDYVLKEDYHLRPLSEVQQFISENHHLPEVPSEKEVLANGQNLGEMNAILLKKIEELTLYVLELKEENRQDKMVVSRMQQELQKIAGTSDSKR